MENKPELIRQQMQQTRTSLTEKLEALECRVMDTMTRTTSAVNETVHTVKDAVQETVSTVRDTVGESAASVKETVGDTMHSVRDTLDLERQVQRHPWAAMGGAVLAGYVGSKMLQRLEAPAQPVAPSHHAPTHLPGADWAEPAGERAAQGNGRAAAAAAAPGEPGWAETMLAPLKPELDNLKALAVGALFNIAKDLLRPHAPPALDRPIEEALDRLTTKFGGRRLEGSILEQGQAAFR